MERIYSITELMIDEVVSLITVSPKILDFCTGSSQVQFIIFALIFAVGLSIWNLPWSDVELYNLYESIGAYGSKIEHPNVIKDAYISTASTIEKTTSADQNVVHVASINGYGYVSESANGSMQSHV